MKIVLYSGFTSSSTKKKIHEFYFYFKKRLENKNGIKFVVAINNCN